MPHYSGVSEISCHFYPVYSGAAVLQFSQLIYQFITMLTLLNWDLFR